MRIAAALLVSAMLLTVPAFADETPAPVTPVEQPAAVPAPEAAATEPAAPTEAAVAAEQQEASAEGDADRVICRSVRRLESRLRRSERICGTRDQWEQMQDDAARNTRRSGSIQGRSGS